MSLKTKRLCEVGTKTERLAQPVKNQSVGRKPKTSGGVTIKQTRWVNPGVSPQRLGDECMHGGFRPTSGGGLAIYFCGRCRQSVSEWREPSA